MSDRKIKKKEGEDELQSKPPPVPVPDAPPSQSIALPDVAPASSKVEYVGADDITVEKSRESRLQEMEKIRQAKKDKKRARRRAKAAKAAAARAQAQMGLSDVADGKEETPPDDGSIDSNLSMLSNQSISFSKDEEEMSIEGEDPAPDNIKNMVKNAVKGIYDPNAWTQGK